MVTKRRDHSPQGSREDAMWEERREQRKRIAARGTASVWGRSPQIHEIAAIYAEYERMEAAQLQEDAKMLKAISRKKTDDEGDSPESGKHGKKRKKKHGKDKKKSDHKKHKKKHSEHDESEEEWVEVTNEMRQAEAERVKQIEAEMIGPVIPDYLIQKEAALLAHSKHVNYGKDMLRGEAAAMAAYIAQGKRIPRRGEIGLSSVEIAEFEKIGYVMSGTRHKSMEATRLRKENQVMTAEEKRVLSGFTQEERKKKEELVLQQFRSFVDSKKSKS